MEEDKVQELLAMYDAGVNVINIAAELGVSGQTIRRVLKEHGKEISRRAAVLDEEAIVKDYVGRMAVPEILAKYKITYAMLYKILATNGIPTRKIENASGHDMRLDHAVQMYEAGLPIWTIKQETGIAQPTLHAELHRRSIPLRRPRML